MATSLKAAGRLPHNKAGKRVGPAKTSITRPVIITPTIRQAYDTENGQVYTERQVRVMQKQRSDWIGELRTPAIRKTRGPNSHGARKLLEMAVIQLSRNSRTLTAEHFVDVPWELAKKLWIEIISIRGESFHAWRTLASAYPDRHEFGDRSYRYLLELKQPSLPFADYSKEITSSHLNWLVSLRISPKQFNAAILVSIAQITNLAVLDLSDGQAMMGNGSSPFDERVMRAWKEQVTINRSFSHLRVLLLGWQENLSSWIFKYTDSFPSLHQVIVTDCAQMHQKNRSEWEEIAHAHGWEARHAKKSAKLLKPLISDKDFHFGAVSSCYYTADNVNIELDGQSIQQIVARPMLECWLGTPRLWTHIIDDFPGTRTIYFEKIGVQSVNPTHNDGVPWKTPGDKVKRLRDLDQSSSGSRSPPSKRVGPGKPWLKAKSKSVTDLLEEFMS